MSTTTTTTTSIFDAHHVKSEGGVHLNTHRFKPPRSPSARDRSLEEWLSRNGCLVAFDLRFIFQRSVLLGIQPHPIIPFNARPWDSHVFDTMVAWAGVGNRVSLDKLCRVFGIPTKGSELGGDEIDGSKVWDYVQAGRVADVAIYCGGDVDRVREIHRRMTFAYQKAAA